MLLDGVENEGSDHGSDGGWPNQYDPYQCGDSSEFCSLGSMGSLGSLVPPRPSSQLSPGTD